MLISHEVPLSLLEESKLLNDYDYCLLHLTYEYPDYKDYYINSIKSGRQVLLDNSLFELGDALTNDQLAQGVIEIKPTWYVVPDCLNNKNVTIDRFEKFKRDYGKLPGMSIGVVQGSTLLELVECYQFMSKNADKIAIPFDSRGFDYFSEDIDNLKKWCEGRQLFIKYLVDNNFWNNSKPHHLLGCSLAREFRNPLYRKINIETIDTSNPVVAAINYLKYEEDGLNCKPVVKLCNLIDYKLSPLQHKLLNHNINVFKDICHA